jgi:hypothetical protein
LIPRQTGRLTIGRNIRLRLSERQFSWHPSVGSWDQTQTESVSIEDSRGEQLPEKTKKRDGLVRSHRLERRYTSTRVIIARSYGVL